MINRQTRRQLQQLSQASQASQNAQARLSYLLQTGELAARRDAYLQSLR